MLNTYTILHVPELSIKWNLTPMQQLRSYPALQQGILRKPRRENKYSVGMIFKTCCVFSQRKVHYVLMCAFFPLLNMLVDVTQEVVMSDYHLLFQAA